MKIFKIGDMSTERIVKGLYRLSIITFILYIMHRIIKYEMPWLFWMDGKYIDVNLQHKITHWYFLLKAYLPPIIVLSYFKLFSEAIYKVLIACDKYVNGK